MPRMLISLVVLWLTASGLSAQSIRPDLQRTPGVRNPDVMQATIRSTICKRGWTKTIRPPSTYTDQLKREEIAALHLRIPSSACEEDHFLPLELGGHPTDPKNLWCEAYAGPWGAKRKDVLETRLKTLVCNGTISLATAQQAILKDWPAAYVRYVVRNARVK